MNKQTKFALLIAAVAAAATSAHAATYNGDLLVGFTSQTGNDVVYDLGSASSLTDFESWSLGAILSAQGLSASSVQWGVVGDKNIGGTRNVWTTVANGGNPPHTVPSTSAFNSIDTADKALYVPFITPGDGQSDVISSTSADSWNEQTIQGSLVTEYHNVYENPNVDGATTDNFYDAVAGGSAPTFIGNFDLSQDGTLTFNTPEISNTCMLLGVVLLGMGLGRRQLVRNAS